ncbi:MAG: tetratricopeptide repeat protein [Vulcanimicrobiota bacterium]
MMKKIFLIIMMFYLICFPGCSRSKPAPDVPGTPTVTELDKDQSLPTPAPSPSVTGSPSLKLPTDETPTPAETEIEEESYLQQGINELESANYKGAISNLNKALKEAPENADAYAYRGRAYMDFEDYEKAERDLDKALQLEPENAKANYFMGILKQRTFQDGAMSYFERALEKDSNNANIYFRMGEMEFDAGNIENGIKLLNRVIELEPESENAKLAREMIQSAEKK